MLKPLTFSVSLAVALGACSLGYAGGHHKSLPSAQGIAPSPQGILPSPQGEVCGEVCGPRKRCHLFDMFKHREKCYTYEWVLKKKRCGGLFGHKNKGCGGEACGGCGEVYPSAQWPSAQGAVYGTGQAEIYGAGQMTGPYGAGQMGSGQIGAPAGTVMPSANGDNVGPAPEAAPPTANPPGDETASNGSLLFLAPAGN